ncbi:aspartyl/asparaginyl beta-hydroxylase domain-containing protein [Actinokineospora xionganensis]|uniref:Aspartyl/asparaginyl beta-hydroxylase domain-containing protein n=1 Tax=Actinokineospora xionganensis TaxID=2684470 RepID=A0ABR7L0Q2_9PSEU|nr:aspartyl/asparaginyl beta-hydroxylase domain-containing protein [Actinokineospora xionganensis]MBC6446014.1 aspartyl/asparaginyl beta-hydroxylase domain-containing protein [Actinokineospora xionganensis]
MDFPVDHDALKADIEVIDAMVWDPQATAGVDQIITRRDDVDHAVISLISPNADIERTDPGRPGEEYGRTRVLDQLPTIAALIDALPCDKMSVRLMRLTPGGQVALHVDSFFGFDYGKVRLHVPLTTTSTSRMVFGDDTIHWPPGNLWYGDFSTMHTITNDGPGDRVHIVADLLLSDELVALFPESHRPLDPMISRRPLEQAPPPPLAAGTWPAEVSGRALDWTRKDDAALDAPVAVEFVVDDDGTFAMRFPSGVLATLWPVADGAYRVGRMPEETMVVVEDGVISVVRRRGDVRRSFPCTLRAENAR